MKQKKGFTLIELMVVIVIMGILVTIGTFAFQSSQKKSRDARRKSDLSQVAKALEMYNSDVGAYPEDDAGKIKGCGDTPKTVCAWGSMFFNTTKATYMVKLPKEPMSNRVYYYKPATKGYLLYARLENLEDSAAAKIEEPVGSGTYLPGVYSQTNCGGVCCNYVLTSSNISEPVPVYPNNCTP
jgi:type II secretion system protein G